MTAKLIKVGIFMTVCIMIAFTCRQFIFAAQPGASIDVKTAYIIIDIQNDYFPGGKLEMLNSTMAAENAKKVLEFFRKKKLTVIHIRHENTAPTATFFIPGTEGANIHSSVTPLKNEPVLLKHKPSSFIGTTLDEDLKAKGITHLIISGMQSNVCVRSTTLEALTKNYKVTVVDDAIAAKNIEVHNTAVAEIVEKGAQTVKAASIIGRK
jgi:nicotinamidase-related amidase